MGLIDIVPWSLYFGSMGPKPAGAGIALVSPSGDRFAYSFQLGFE